MSRHTILLGVDGALLVELDSRDRQYAAYRIGEEYRPLPVPVDARTLEMSGPGGRGPYYFRPAVIQGLRNLAAKGADIVWNTRWLAAPHLLRDLSGRVGLEGAVRQPAAAELPAAPVDVRVDVGPNALWDHWKVRALVRRLRELPSQDEIVVVDSVLDFSSRRLPDGLARRAGRADVPVGGIKTYDERGLDEPAIEALSAWLDGGSLPRM